MFAISNTSNFQPFLRPHVTKQLSVAGQELGLAGRGQCDGSPRAGWTHISYLHILGVLRSLDTGQQPTFCVSSGGQTAWTLHMKVELGPNGVGLAAVWTPSGAPVPLLPEGTHSTLIVLGSNVFLWNYGIIMKQLNTCRKIYISGLVAGVN